MVVPASFFCNGNNVIMTKLDRAASQLCKYKFVKAIHNVSCAPHDIVVDPPIFSDHHLTSCKFMIVQTYTSSSTVQSRAAIELNR